MVILTVPDPKRKAPAVTPARQSPRHVAGVGKIPVQEKLLASSMHATYATNTHQCFPEVSPPRSRLREKTQEEGPAKGSTFPAIEKILQDKLFAVINSRN